MDSCVLHAPVARMASCYTCRNTCGADAPSQAYHGSSRLACLASPSLNHKSPLAAASRKAVASSEIGDGMTWAPHQRGWRLVVGPSGWLAGLAWTWTELSLSLSFAGAILAWDGWTSAIVAEVVV